MLVSDIINERVEIVSIDSYYIGKGRRVAAEKVKKVRVVINPSKEDFDRFAAQVKDTIRFIVGMDDSLYVCKASDATHFDIVHHTGIDEKYAGYIEPGKILIRRDQSIREMGPILRANEHILDAMGGANFEIARRVQPMNDF